VDYYPSPSYLRKEQKREGYPSKPSSKVSKEKRKLFFKENKNRVCSNFQDHYNKHFISEYPKENLFLKKHDNESLSNTRF